MCNRLRLLRIVFPHVNLDFVRARAYTLGDAARYEGLSGHTLTDPRFVGEVFCCAIDAQFIDKALQSLHPLFGPQRFSAKIWHGDNFAARCRYVCAK